MPTTGHSRYKGCSITTRWTELEPLPETRAKRFNASFSVDPADAEESPWQQFEASIFDTSVHAASNALMAAKRSIDSRPTDW